jgi:hypothetical protein
VDEQSLEGVHLHVRPGRADLRQHFDPLFQREEGRFGGIAGDGDQHAFKQRRRALDNIQMSVCHRVETARNECACHINSP